MTKVGQIIEEEKQQAIAEMRRQADEEIKEARRQVDEEIKEARRQVDEEIKEARRQADEEKQEAIKENARGTAQKLLKCGISIDQILQCIDGLTRGELEAMK